MSLVSASVQLSQFRLSVLTARYISVNMKRSTDSSSEDTTAGPAKVPKLAPIFEKPAASTSTFRWLKQSKEKATLLHGVNLDPPNLTKVAAFDLDGTLIASSIRQGTAKSKSKNLDPLQWDWWRPGVSTKLGDLAREGYSIIIITNQSIRSNQLEAWKKKIPLIAARLPDVPFRIFAATAKDGYRKPMPGMWYELESIFSASNVTIDKTASFFVGDAAGRNGDFASTDRKWALNVGIPFQTPEEYFLGLPPVGFSLAGFNVSSLPILPPYTPTSTPLIPLTPADEIESAGLAPELILFCGPPAVGKSTFFAAHFAPAGYIHVNQDALGTRQKCIAKAKESLAQGRSVVIDNTNRDAQTRKYYVDLAKSLEIPIRCFLFANSVELARHNNLYRAFIAPVKEGETRRSQLPDIAIASFASAYEEPTLAEGFIEIKRVNFVFEGTEEERKLWSMWLSTETK